MLPADMRSSAAVLVPLLLLLPALSHAQGARTVSTRFTPPDRIAGFRVTSVTQMEGGAGGHLLYRSADGLELDTYLYPLPEDPDCLTGCDAVAADREADTFPSLIPAMVERGYFDSLAVERDEPVRVEHAGMSAHGRHLWLAGSAAGRPVRFHLLVFGVGTSMMKVRATFPPSARRDGLVSTFASEFVRTMLQPAAGARDCANGPADPESIRLNLDSGSAIGALRGRAGSMLTGLGFELAPAADEKDVWRTLPTEGWPVGIDYGPWAGEASPGFVVEVRLEDRAGSARVTVGAQALCSPRYLDEDPRSLELALEHLTASAVLEKLVPRNTRP